MELHFRLISVCAVLALAAALVLGCTACSGAASGTPDAASAAPDAAPAASASLPEQAPDAGSLPDPEPEPEPEPEVFPSDNWQDLQLVIENVLISLPARAEQLEQTSFQLYPPQEDDVQPGGWGTLYSEHPAFEAMDFGCGLYNPGAEAVSPMECPIYEITFSFFGMWTEDEAAAERPDVKLPGGITLYSHLQDIIDAYGEPDTMNRMDSIPDSTYCDITYRTPEGHFIMFAFDGEDQHIMTAKISCAPEA